MKRLISFLLLPLLMACSGDANVSVGERTTMDIERVYDAGTVVKGELVTAKFKVTNTGNTPLVIGSVDVACSCTLAQKPEEPIQPGESDVIVANVETERLGVGKLDKGVTLTANTKPSMVELKIKGNIINK